MPLPLLTVFADVPDPRRETANKLHRLGDVLVLATCGVLGGAESWDSIYEYGRTKESFFRRFLELPHGIPSADTFERVFAKLDPQAFARAFGQLDPEHVLARRCARGVQRGGLGHADGGPRGQQPPLGFAHGPGHGLGARRQVQVADPGQRGVGPPGRLRQRQVDLHVALAVAPAARALGHGIVIPGLDPPSSILGGEAFLARIYNAYKAMQSPAGSNVWNTTLLIGWDEPGGTFDHVPPGPVPPPV